MSATASASQHTEAKEGHEVDEEQVTNRRTTKAINIQNRVIVSTSPLLDVRNMNAKQRGAQWVSELAIGTLSKPTADEFCRLLKSVKGLQARATMALYIGLVLAGLDDFEQSEEWYKFLFFNQSGILNKHL